MNDASGNTTPESTQSKTRTASAVAVAEGEDSKGVLRPLMRTAPAVDIKVIGNLTEPTRQGTECPGDNNQLNLGNNGNLRCSAVALDITSTVLAGAGSAPAPSGQSQVGLGSPGCQNHVIPGGIRTAFWPVFGVIGSLR